MPMPSLPRSPSLATTAHPGITRLRALLLLIVLVATTLASVAAPGPAPQASLRALAAGARPPDRRLGELRTLDTHCPFTPPTTADAWRMRATALRRQIRVALGLWPWPTRTPLNASVHGTATREEYAVDSVAFESLPGHYVTGSVYRPLGRAGRLPAVLSPHGHWPGGRFQDVTDEDARRALETGAEPLDVSARHFLEARAVHLARLGAVVFLLDLEGYADSQQLGTELVHEFKAERPDMHGRDSWGFFSPQAELHLQSMLGLVAWNAVRAVDYLASRPDVDPARIGVTGASGGGTQTFLLGAIDDRPAALFPAVMVSTHMQGGCTCENASYLRIGTNNVEIAALAAPRPLAMTAADDWTREMEQDGYPELRRLYATLGVPDAVRLSAFLQFPHNYNGPSRAAMYDWFNRHLGLGWNPVPPERAFTPLSRAEAGVWNDAHPAPEHGPAHERALVAWLTADARRAFDALVPRDAAGWPAFRETVGGAWDVMLGGGWAEGDVAAFDTARRAESDDAIVTTGLITRRSSGAALPAVLLSPRGPVKGVVVWADGAGKSALTDDVAVRPLARALVAAGFEVLGLDTLDQGEFIADGTPFEHVRLASPRPHAGYTFGYNLPLPAERTQDVLTALQVARARAGANGRVLLVGRGTGAAWAAGARLLAAGLVNRTALDFGGFRFDRADRIDHPDLLPGAARYGDVDALVALGAPGDTWLADADAPAFPVARSVYAAHAKTSLVVGRHGLERKTMEWLTK